MKEYQVSFTTKDIKPCIKLWTKRLTYNVTENHHLEVTMIMYGVYNSDTLTDLIDTVHRMQNFTAWNEKTFAGKLHDWIELYAQDEGICNYAINLVLFLTTVRENM